MSHDAEGRGGDVGGHLGEVAAREGREGVLRHVGMVVDGRVARRRRGQGRGRIAREGELRRCDSGGRSGAVGW